MVKRVAASVLWLLGVGWGLNYVSAILGAPPIIGFAVSAAIAAFVGIDPLRLFWPVANPTSAATPLREPAPISGIVRPNV